MQHKEWLNIAPPWFQKSTFKHFPAPVLEAPSSDVRGIENVDSKVTQSGERTKETELCLLMNVAD
jgi:hypothetical protein